MKLQAKLLAKVGVTISVAEQLMEKRIGEIERRLLPINHMREVDAARTPRPAAHVPPYAGGQLRHDLSDAAVRRRKNRPRSRT